MTSVPRTRAPELRGRGWLNTGGRRLALADLRGRWVLLDFWTFCCINCLHVLDELRPVEDEHHDELVVVGVHSPKFAHEADPVALARAVERYGVAHPVLDDPELVTWQAYAARAWPTLVLVDPEGYVVAQYAGEGHAHAVDALVTELSPTYAERGTLRPGEQLVVAPERAATDLRFPAKAVPLPDGTVLVADTGHDRLVVLDGERVVRPLGEGAFREPNGLCLLPPDLAASVGYDVVVADTVQHRLAGVRLGDGTVVDLVAGLNSPWDVAWWQDRVWVAMAGDHTLATYDPVSGRLAHAGGTRNEGLLDGPLEDAWFAQPSGLAPDGPRLWVADAETSALRYVEDGVVTTVVGEGLFDFGHRDGPRDVARMQHPLGVLATGDAVLVADTYNGAVRRYDLATGELGTVATGLAEPSGLLALRDGEVGEVGEVLVVESAAHRVRPVALRPERVDGPASRARRPPTDVAGGEVVLRVPFAPPPGQKVDERFGPATQLQVSATPPALLRDGDGTGTGLTRTLVLDPAVGDGVLHVSARAASCDTAGGEGAACRMHQQDWGIPVRITADGVAELVLPLGGTSA